MVVVVDWPGTGGSGGPYSILRDLWQSCTVSGWNGDTDTGTGRGQVRVDGCTGQGVGVSRCRVRAVVSSCARRVDVDCGSSGARQHGVGWRERKRRR